MMAIKTENPEVKDQIKRRLSRIEGQLRGVQRMIDEERDCRDVVQQLIAIRSAVQAASLNFMQDVASDCLLNQADQDDPAAQRALMTDLIKMLGKVS
jgi:CsoR family transcriptional regulator, copper-sensing transcriptional repressor